ncbi:DUF1289 domain-containing protein [Paraburkholderia youngii]
MAVISPCVEVCASDGKTELCIGCFLSNSRRNSGLEEADGLPAAPDPE